VSRKLPYLQFYTGDWLKDPAVSLCSPATRGVWIDLLCAMHEAGRVGSLSGTPEQLARLARCVPSDLAQALTDIQATGAADVTERNGVVTVTNRRMAREAKERSSNALRQAKRRGSAVCHDKHTPLSHLYDSESETDFLNSVPENLRGGTILEALKLWLVYKHGRGESYEPTGRRMMFSRASKLAALHGTDAVADAIERAIANRWQGWDQPSSFGNGRPAGKHPMSHVPDLLGDE
jgi:hypothetical protein